MEDLEEDLENLRPQKNKKTKKKEAGKLKRPEKRIKMSSFIDDEAIEVSDESDQGDAESMFSFFKLYFFIKYLDNFINDFICLSVNF